MPLTPKKAKRTCGAKPIRLDRPISTKSAESSSSICAHGRLKRIHRPLEPVEHRTSSKTSLAVGKTSCVDTCGASGATGLCSYTSYTKQFLLIT